MNRFRLAPIAICVAGVAFAAAYLMAGTMPVVEGRTSDSEQLVDPAPLEMNPRQTTYVDIINRPAGPPRVNLGVFDRLGQPITASCTTCHSSRQPNSATVSAEELDLFHQGMTYAHGSLTCLSCHNPEDYDMLRLADGTSVEYADVMTLCAQCHGPQTRDFKHGAHGGMTGYWDRSRGPRHRNNCIDCHDPHAPAFPMMLPSFKPRDRFLTPHSNAERTDGH